MYFLHELVLYVQNTHALYLLYIRFDAIVSADAFEKLKPAPDIFLSASNILNVPPSEVLNSTNMRSYLGV